MKVSEKIIKAWNEKRTRGDIKRLMAYTNASKPTVIKALTHREATPEIILKISEFYSEKIILTPEDVEIKALKLISNATKQIIRRPAVN